MGFLADTWSGCCSGCQIDWQEGTGYRLQDQPIARMVEGLICW